MNHPLKITYDDVAKCYTVDHVNRRQLNKIKVFYLRAPGLSYKDVRTTRPVGRDCFFDRDKDIIYLGDDEFQLAQGYGKMEPSDLNRYFISLLRRCGLSSWIDAVS